MPPAPYRPSSGRARDASDFPPIRTSAIDHLARYRAAFAARGWRVLPGLVPRYHTLVRRYPAGAIDPDDTEGVARSGPEADKALTAVHPTAPLAVTVVVLRARHQPLYDVWWDGIPAHHVDDDVIAECYATEVADAVRAATATD